MSKAFILALLLVVAAIVFFGITVLLLYQDKYLHSLLTTVIAMLLLSCGISIIKEFRYSLER